jgi:hypothetical protein
MSQKVKEYQKVVFKCINNLKNWYRNKFGLLSTVTACRVIDQGLISGWDINVFICHKTQNCSQWTDLPSNVYNGPSETKGSMLIWHCQCSDWDEKQAEDPHYCALITADNWHAWIVVILQHKTVKSVHIT